MFIDSLTIEGLRGFGDPQTLRLAVPNSKAGSGLTILVGPNNGGKSTVVEAFRALASRRESVSFTEGKRNKTSGDKVSLRVSVGSGLVYELKTKTVGGSETDWIVPKQENEFPAILALPSRRYFDPYFGKNTANRESYAQSPVPQNRGSVLHQFSGRLFDVLNNRSDFDAVLRRVIEPAPEWTIDQSDQGNFYVKFTSGDCHHTSDGLGEGIVSLLFIVDALYDSEEGDIIVIDEPELSLHPSLQRRLFDLLVDYAKTIQIIYATHSPYFVDFRTFVNGSKLARVHKNSSTCVISQLNDSTVNDVTCLLNNLNNPHILDLTAREAFFLEDSVVLTEGQEDVVVYKQILNQLGIAVKGTFFGWGVGGAGNMGLISQVLHDLGFKKVVGMLDANKTAECEQLARRFPNYEFHQIPTADIRSKRAQKAKGEVEGLTNHDGQIKAEHSSNIGELFTKVNRYLEK